MLRLIDIVLILLFGFISISHIDRAIEMQLPHAEYLPLVPPDFEDWTVVGALHDGGFVCGVDKIELADDEALREYLSRAKAEQRGRVRLRVDLDLPGAYIARVLELCGDLEIPVALEVIRDRPEVVE